MKHWLSTMRRHSLYAAVIRTLSLQGGLLVASTIISILVTRSLGADARGALSLLMVYSGLGASLALCGVPLAAKKYITEHPASLAAIFWSGSAVMLASSLFFAGCFYLYGQTTSIVGQHTLSFALALCLLPLVAYAALHNNVLLGIDAQRRFHQAVLIEKGGVIVLNITLLVTGYVSPMLLIAANVLVLTLRLGMTHWWLRHDIFVLPELAQCKAALGRMRHMATSAYISHVSLMYVQAIFVIVLGMCVSADALGYFAAAKILTDMLQIIPLTIGTYATQHVMKQAAAHDYTAARVHILMLSIGMSVLAMMPLVLLPETVVTVLYGTAFTPAADILPWLAVGGCAYGIMVVSQSIIGAHTREWLQVGNVSAALITATATLLYYYDTLDAMLAARLYAITMLIGAIGAIGCLGRVTWEHKSQLRG